MTSLADSPGNVWCHRYFYQIVYSSKECSVCQGKLNFKANYAWCKACRVKTSAKAVTWLRSSKLSYKQIYQLVWCWQRRKDPGFVKDALGLSYTTIKRWYSRFRCSLPPDKQNKPLTDLVEADESFFGKQKYGGQKIVLGAIEPSSRRIKLQVVDDRSQSTIESFFELHVASQTAVMTDLHYGYEGLSDIGYDHYSFNHSKGEYSNTNQIENFWGVIKRYMRKLYGCIPTQNLESILSEWVIRQNQPHLFIKPENYLETCLFRIS